jgi:hypothetical protein
VLPLFDAMFGIQPLSLRPVYVLNMRELSECENSYPKFPQQFSQASNESPDSDHFVRNLRNCTELHKPLDECTASDRLFSPRALLNTSAHLRYAGENADEPTFAVF